VSTFSLMFNTVDTMCSIFTEHTNQIMIRMMQSE